MDINKDLQKILKIIDDFKPSHIINFAAQGDVRTSWKYPEQWYKTNFTSLVNFSNKLIGNKYLKKYLSISTPEVYGSTKNKISNQIILIPVLHMLYLNFQLTCI